MATPTPKPVNTPSPKPVNTPTPTPVYTPTPTPVNTVATVAPTATPVVITPTIKPTEKPKEQENIKYKKIGNSGYLTINGIDLAGDIKNNPGTVLCNYREIEQMLHIVYKSRNDLFENNILSINDDLVEGILFVKNPFSKDSSIRITSKVDLEYIIEGNSVGTTIKITKKAETTKEKDRIVITENPNPTPKPTATPIPPTPVPTVVATPKPVVTPISIPSPTPKATVAPTATPTPTVNRGDTANDTFKYNVENNRLDIIALNYSNYNIFRMTNPERIIIDLPGNKVEANEIVPQGSVLIKKLQTGQFETGTARIVLEVLGQASWTVSENTGILSIQLTPTGTKAVEYFNDGNDFYLKLTAPGLRSKYIENKDRITYENIDAKKQYSMIFPYDMIDLGAGNLPINDLCVGDVLTYSNSAIKKSILTFNEKYQYTDYEIITNDNLNQLIIKYKKGVATQSPADTSVTPSTNLPKPTRTGKFIVIDPGHGGSEPGAPDIHFGTMEEKNINLDISLRLDKLLTANGIEHKTLRTSDSFIGLYERAEMANDLKADLFVSIHNNAFPDKSMSGSMTFYYPTSYKGKN